MGELRLFGEPESAFSGDHADLTNVTPDQHHPQLHKASHVAGGGDAFAAGDLLNATARVAVRKNSGADVGVRRRLNLIEGSNITLTVADDAANEEIGVTIAASGGGGGLLAYTEYRPGPDTQLSTTSTAFVDVDAANLAVTFTAPTSGKVLIRLTAAAKESTEGHIGFWNLREGTTNVPRSSGRVVTYNWYTRLSHTVIVTGLTPGNAYTYKWGWRANTGTTWIIVGDADQGSAIMEVWAI